MYPSVPSSVPTLVSITVGLSVPAGMGSAERARPKSRIFTRSSRVRKMLSGFTSRWTICFACAASSPSAMAAAISTAPFHGSGRASRRARRVSPSSNSVTEYGTPLIDAEIEDGQDVRVRQGRNRPGFALETRPRRLVVGEPLAQHLDRDLAVEARVARAIHLTHPALAEGAQDVVVAEATTGTDGEKGRGRHVRDDSNRSTCRAP